MSKPIYQVEGNWEISFAGDRAKSAFCRLIQTDNTFTGIFHGPRGNLPIKGALNNKGNIAFIAESILGDFNFFGIINGKNMYGTVYFPRGKCQENWIASKIVND
jgi:hypothetical protein